MPNFNQVDNITYKQNLSKQELMGILKAILIPIGVFTLSIFTISQFAGFGSKLICPLSGAMWIVGVIVAALMPSMRKETMRQTLIICTIYYCTLLLLKVLLGLVSGVSSEMIAASYNQAIPTATGNMIPGYVQTMMWFTAVGIPIGQISMQGKRLFQFRRNQTLQRTFGQERRLHNTNNN